MSTLWTPYVEPQPDSIAEERMRGLLKSFDSLLDIKWLPNAVFNDKHEKYEGRYAYLCKWPLADKRYGLIQSGEIGDFPYDILGWVTEDIHNAGSPAMSPDAVEQQIVKLLASADNERTPWKQRMAQTIAKNRAVKAALKNEVEQMTHDAASYLYNQVKGNPIVNVTKDIK